MNNTGRADLDAELARELLATAHLLRQVVNDRKLGWETPDALLVERAGVLEGLAHRLKED